MDPIRKSSWMDIWTILHPYFSMDISISISPGDDNSSWTNKGSLGDNKNDPKAFPDSSSFYNDYTRVISYVPFNYKKISYH